MQASRTTLTRFYNASAHLDPNAMALFHAPYVRFHDEIYALEGHEKGMVIWRMLCESVEGSGRPDCKLNYRVVSVNADTG